MPRALAADDFAAIRRRMEELRRERQQPTGGAPDMTPDWHRASSLRPASGQTVSMSEFAGEPV